MESLKFYLDHGPLLLPLMILWFNSMDLVWLFVALASSYRYLMQNSMEVALYVCTYNICIKYSSNLLILINM